MRKMKTKRGATSFYIVAFSTLILVIIAASFTAVILSEMARTENDDLSKSAYDSALAGVEDAKLAFYNYQKCLSGGKTDVASAITVDGTITCAEIMYWMDNPDCYMVARILGRIGEGVSVADKPEVLIEESSIGGNDMQQAYTCVKFTGKLSDYQTTLSSSGPKIVRIKLGKDSDGNQIHADDIKNVVVSWFDRDNLASFGNTRYSNVDVVGKKIEFAAFDDNNPPVPPVLSVELIQTANTFSLSDFEKINESEQQTNRGSLFLVPVNNSIDARSKANAYKNDSYGNYISAYSAWGEKNEISKDLLVKSNDHKIKNLPIAVSCGANLNNEDYLCSTKIELPKAYGGGRNDDTFMFVLSTPYGQYPTQVSLELYCDENKSCGKMVTEGGKTEQKPVILDRVQIAIDATGRANDLYRRVETRLSPAGSSLFPVYGISLLGDAEEGGLLQKPKTVTCEYDSWSGFGPTC